MNDQPTEFAELSQFEVHDESVQLLGYGFCRRKHVVILGRVDADGSDEVQVAMLDPTDDALLRNLRGFLKRPIKPVLLNAYEILKALDQGYGKAADNEASTDLDLRETDDLNFAPDHPVSLVLDELLGRAVTLRASDIHVERYPDDVDVRFRIDGVLQQVSTPVSLANVATIVSRLKVLAGLNIAERRVAQDGRLTATFEGDGAPRSVDFRLSTVPGPDGEDAVLRLLDTRSQLVPLHQLGWDEVIQRRIQAVLANPEGMLLVTGPTGSGKTTTLYSMLDAINTDANKVLTVENPIEYRFPKINQKQADSAMGFADYARAFLRQDPDVIMIGEIRDEETARAAARAAQTGHLVLSTLHTSDSVGAVARLECLGVEPSTLAGVLLGVLAQRLVRALCASCRSPAEPDPFAHAIFSRLGRSFPAFSSIGCQACGGTGFRGRLGIFELLAVDQSLADYIGADAPALDIRLAARRGGMTTLFDHAIARVEAGQISFAELRRAVPVRIINEPAL